MIQALEDLIGPIIYYRYKLIRIEFLMFLARKHEPSYQREISLPTAKAIIIKHLPNSFPPNGGNPT
jgi:hypothetical protein